MSAQLSNLSQSQYAYDLVVATTQEAVNITMKEFLAKMSADAYAVCYTYQGRDKPYKEMDLQQIIKESGADPFTIPQTADPGDPRLKKLYDLGFEFAFKAKPGLPAGIAPRAMPDVVVLNKGRSAVTYRLFFAELAVVALKEDRGDITWINLSQQPGAPWMFDFEVNLNLTTGGDEAFGKLSPEDQQRLKNLNPDTAFSVQQLYLDLNTTALQSLPAIEGLDKSSDAYRYLTQVFLDTYWDRAKQAGGVLLGRSVVPATPNQKQPAVIPTDLAIEVSPFIDGDGKATEQYGLYTLNYLVMSNKHVMLEWTPFPWNWIDTTEQSDAHGVMAVKKSRFAGYLNQVLSPALSQICVAPSASIKTPLAGSDEYNYEYALVTAPQTYREVSDGASHVLTFAYSGYDMSKDWDEAGTAIMRLRCDTSSDVYFELNHIRMVTRFTGYANVSHASAVVDGNLVEYEVTTTYQINVDSEGAMIVSLVPGPSTPENKAQPLSTDAWTKLRLGDAVAKLESTLAGFATALTKHDQSILGIINNSSAWVFPAGRTFTFKNAYFSNNQDLVTHIIYDMPDSTPA